jgi:hypothetical protein
MGKSCHLHRQVAYCCRPLTGGQILLGMLVPAHTGKTTNCSFVRMNSLCQMALSSGLSLACAAGCRRADRPVLPSKLYSTPPSCIVAASLRMLPFQHELTRHMLQMVLDDLSSGLVCRTARQWHLDHLPCINFARVLCETVEVGVKGRMCGWRLLTDG